MTKPRRNQVHQCRATTATEDLEQRECLQNPSSIGGASVGVREKRERALHRNRKLFLVFKTGES